MGQSFTRTSRSRLPDRAVRVDRRLRVDDGAFGTYQSWTTIVQRYAVRLWPDQMPRRDRTELGETVADSVQLAFKALGDPSRNGRRIRVGDRFVDLTNNRCYDVVAVPHNRGRSPYSAMIQYELRQVNDDCHEVEVPYTNSDEPETPAAAQSHFIMRHLASDEIFGWDELPYFDGVIYNLQYDDPLQLAELAALVAAGRRWWRYYAILDFPYSAALLGGQTPPLSTWFNYLRDTVQFAGSASHRRMRVGDTVSLFAIPAVSGEQRELIPHGVLSSGERSALVSTMVSLALAPGGVLAPASGVFFDQAWLNVEDFQVEGNPAAESGHGDTKGGSPKLTALDYAGAEAAFGDGGAWTTHRAGLMALYQETAAALGNSRYVIKNGEHRSQGGDSVPYPWMFENAWNNNLDGGNQAARWAAAKAGHAEDSRNILSIVCDSSGDGIQEALDHWEAVGGWLSFTNDDTAEGIAAREQAYAQAAAILAALGWPT